MPGSDRKPPKPLGDLEDRLKAAREKAKGRAPREYSEGMGAGLRISVDLAAAVLVGTGIGIVLDRWLGTSPWLLIVFFILGCAAGFLNVYRTAQEMEARAKERRAEREREERGRSGSERNEPESTKPEPSKPEPSKPEPSKPEPSKPQDRSR